MELGVFNPLYGTFASRLGELAVANVQPGMKCLDLGTGSGYLASALARAGAEVDACDIHPESCVLAARNAVTNGVAVTVIHSEGFSAISTSSSYDLIVANLPFCRAPLMDRFSTSPYHRCFAASKGLLTEVAEGALSRLKPGGKLLFCYATSGWLEELDQLCLRHPGSCSVFVQERSTCEIRWIIGMTKHSADTGTSL
jgi:release factor glutamine methyltransferase